MFLKHKQKKFSFVFEICDVISRETNSILRAESESLFQQHLLKLFV